MSFHGSRQIPTPNLDLLASTGVVLHNYYVSPVCSPSRSALLTGLNPIRTGMQVGVIGASEPYGLSPNFTTMADHFRSLDYSTHVVGKWHQGFFREEYLPTRRGFDSFLGYLTGHLDYYDKTGGDLFVGYDFYENEDYANLSQYYNQYTTDIYTDRVVHLIEDHARNQSKPFFIYMAHQAVHGGNIWGEPLQPPTRFHNLYPHIEDGQRRKFAGMVAALDQSVGRVFRALHETGQLDRTILFFSTDNGGATGGLDGQQIDRSKGSNLPLKGAKYTLWEGGVRGTAFAWSAALAKTPHVSHNLMHITDVLPTLYRAVGGDPHSLADIDGVSQWDSLLRPEEPSPRSHLLHNIDHSEPEQWAVRAGDHKLTSGTSLAGNYDLWYVAPGQRTEQPPGGIEYSRSAVYPVLQQMGLNVTSVLELRVKCANPAHPTPCNGTSTDLNDLCLFDLSVDPCEQNNIAAKHPDVVKKLYGLYEQYNQQYAKPANQPWDPKANPIYHHGFWSPWK